jgi:hypothetical protein
MAGVFFAVLGIVAFVAFMWWALAMAKRQREKLARMFTEAAERAGGRFTPGQHGFFKNVSPSITVHRDGTTIVTDTYVVSTGKSSTTYSRISATFALGRGPELHIRREGALHSIGKVLGMQDLQVGDPGFDETFMIKAPSAAAVLRLLPRDERLALIHQLPGWWVRSDGSSVTMKRLGYPDSAGEVVTAVDVIAAVACGDKRILDLAAAHADARAQGREVIFSGTVEGRFTVDDHGCKLRVPNQQEGPDLAIDCAAADAMELLPEGALEPALAGRLRAIGQARVARDRHHAWVSWRETPDAEAIEAAWRVLVGLAAPSTRVGAFR